MSETVSLCTKTGILKQRHILNRPREVLMIARNVTMHLKANSVAEFNRTLETDIIPLLQKQKGFRDEITFTVPGGREAVAISFWDTKENAEAYSRGSYQEVLKALAKVIDGTPQVQTWEVANSTCHKVAAALAA